MLAFDVSLHVSDRVGEDIAQATRVQTIVEVKELTMRSVNKQTNNNTVWNEEIYYNWQWLHLLIISCPVHVLYCGKY